MPHLWASTLVDLGLGKASPLTLYYISNAGYSQSACFVMKGFQNWKQKQEKSLLPAPPPPQPLLLPPSACKWKLAVPAAGAGKTVAFIFHLLLKKQSSVAKTKGAGLFFICTV